MVPGPESKKNRTALFHGQIWLLGPRRYQQKYQQNELADGYESQIRCSTLLRRRSVRMGGPQSMILAAN
jgi:hypothetical protein